MQKITFVLRKFFKKLLPPEMHFLTPICAKSFVGLGFAPDSTGELTALLAIFRGSCCFPHKWTIKEERVVVFLSQVVGNVIL